MPTALSGGRLPLIGVGGIDSAEAAYARIRAGASLVQLYTALVYRGPRLVGEITQGLARLLTADGFASLRTLSAPITAPRPGAITTRPRSSPRWRGLRRADRAPA